MLCVLVILPDAGVTATVGVESAGGGAVLLPPPPPHPLTTEPIQKNARRKLRRAFMFNDPPNPRAHSRRRKLQFCPIASSITTRKPIPMTAHRGPRDFVGLHARTALAARAIG